MWQRQVENWVYEALPLAGILILLAPLLGPAVAVPVFLSLPVYMLHQYEEHDADRFRQMVNAMIGAKRVGLSLADVWVINVVFVWLLLAGILWLDAAAPGWGVLAAYLLAVNAAVHIAAAIRTRQSNPGLITAIVLFLPLSVWIFASLPATVVQHLVALGLILGLHLGIVVWALRPPSQRKIK